MSCSSTKPTWLSQPMVKSVLVYRNGDPFFPGHRLIIHEKKVSNFEVFLTEVTGGVKAPFGAVRSIYTPRGGHRVRQLEELQSGEQYVAGGREAFKKLNYLDIGEAKKKPAEVNTELTVEDVKPITHYRINVSARFRRPLPDPCTIFLIANGDLLNPAVRLFIPRKALNQWEHVLEMVTEKVALRSGAVYGLYTLDGKLVQSASDLENGQFYVAVGRDKFKKLPYGDLLFSNSTIRRPQGSKASSLPPVVGFRKSKGSGSDRQSKSTVSSNHTGDMMLSPQPPKRKEKREQTQEKRNFSNKPAKVKQNIRTRSYMLQDHDDGIYKAGGKRYEMWGALEIQEDEDTQVEVPVDQEDSLPGPLTCVTMLDAHRFGIFAIQPSGSQPAETVDEEENEEEEEEGYEREVDGEAVNGNSLKKTGENYEDEQEEENLGQVEKERPLHVNGETNEENGEEMEKFNDYRDPRPEEEAQSLENVDKESQIDSPLENTPNPRVTVTSPQGSEKK